MQLALDIGNSRRKLGLFQGKILREQAIWTDWSLEQLTAWATERKVQRIMVSSVAAPVAELVEALRHSFEVFELTAQTPLPFKNEYKTPETLGKDRLAGVAGAQALYPGRHCMVVDCGTCLKYELLTADGRYLGGNIAPGAAMRIKAMHHFTARLPEVPFLLPGAAIGDSTETALQNGALRGAALEILGFARLFRQQLSGPVRLILTGGDADFFVQHLQSRSAMVVPNLTLIGLNHILTHVITQ
jgi:type III pantothenate kinase